MNINVLVFSEHKIVSKVFKNDKVDSSGNVNILTFILIFVYILKIKISIIFFYLLSFLIELIFLYKLYFIKL